MPFTISHVAAVLPAARALPLSALAVGAMVPDAPYYVTGRPLEIAHEWWAWGTIDLLIGAMLWLAWVGLLARPALGMAPAPVRARIEEPRTIRHRCSDARGIAGVVAALLVGVLTHVLWDSFTHPQGWVTVHVEALRTPWNGSPGWQWAQRVSDVLGLVILVAAATAWWRRTRPRTDPAPAPARHRWALAPVLGAGVLGAVAATHDVSPWSVAAFRGITVGMGAALGAATLLAAVGTLASPRREGTRTTRR